MTLESMFEETRLSWFGQKISRLPTNSVWNAKSPISSPRPVISICMVNRSSYWSIPRLTMLSEPYLASFCVISMIWASAATHPIASLADVWPFERWRLCIYGPNSEGGGLSRPLRWQRVRFQLLSRLGLYQRPRRTGGAKQLGHVTVGYPSFRKRSQLRIQSQGVGYPRMQSQTSSLSWITKFRFWMLVSSKIPC